MFVRIPPKIPPILFVTLTGLAHWLGLAEHWENNFPTPYARARVVFTNARAGCPAGRIIPGVGKAPAQTLAVTLG